MEYKTNYKIVSGNKEQFEKELKILSDDGYITYGDLSMYCHDNGEYYSVLVGKLTQIELEQ